MFFFAKKSYADIRKKPNANERTEKEMDQIKIGKFIASCRKEQGMTQAVLAEKLGISDRAISKWETGKSMPDSGIMLELCELLKINVNELLSGERIMAEAYDKRAEENLLAMRGEVEEKNRQMLQTEYWIAIPAVIAGLIMVFMATATRMPTYSTYCNTEFIAFLTPPSSVPR